MLRNPGLRLKLRLGLSRVMGAVSAAPLAIRLTAARLYVCYHTCFPLLTDLRKRVLLLISLPLIMLVAILACAILTLGFGNPTRSAHRTHGGAEL